MPRMRLIVAGTRSSAAPRQLPASRFERTHDIGERATAADAPAIDRRAGKLRTMRLEAGQSVPAQQRADRPPVSPNWDLDQHLIRGRIC